MKQMDDDELRFRAQRKPRRAKRQRLLKTPLLTQYNSSAETNQQPRAPYYWKSPSRPSQFLPPDYESIPGGKQQHLRPREEPSLPVQRREFSASPANSSAYQPSALRLSANRYKPQKLQNKGSMFSFKVNKQISDKFELRQDLKLQFQEQPLYQMSEDLGSPPYEPEQPIIPENRTVEVEMPVEVRGQTSPSVKDILKKLNEKVNKLYSWQISELDLVARLAGEIRALKRPISRDASTTALNRDTNTEHLVSTKIGKILLKTLSWSLQQMVSKEQEESRASPLSPENLSSLKKEIERLSTSLRATTLQKEKFQILETHAIKSPLQKKRYMDDKIPGPLPYKSRQVQRAKPPVPKTSNKRGSPTTLILESSKSSSVPPTKEMSLARPQETKNVPLEIEYWIGELKDEIATARMTLNHVIELTTCPRGQSTQRFKDFVFMIGNCQMLRPFVLPDACINWLVSASEAQVGAIQGLTQLLQTVKQFIKSLVEEKDLETIRNIHAAIQRSFVLDQILPSLDAIHKS